MKKTIITLFFSICTIILHSQVITIRGEIIDTDKQPIPYASVALLEVDSTLVTGTITDNAGKFVLPNIETKEYILSLSYIGYTTHKEKIIPTDKEYTFILKDDAYQLSEVQITANKSNIIKSSAAAQTFMLSANAIKKKDILEAIEEIPSLNIDFNTRTINLSDGSRPLILINGIRREGGLGAINPEEIISVDVVKTASAEFMREGYTSIVNIKVKKTESSYTSFNGGFSTHPLIRFGIADASLEFGNNNHSLYLTGKSFAFLSNKSDIKEWSQTDKSTRNVLYKRNAHYSDIYFALGGDKNWSDADYSSFSTTFNYIPQNSDANGKTVITNTISEEEQIYDYTKDFDDKLWTASANLYHKHNFAESALEFLLKFNFSDNKNKADQFEKGVNNNIISNYDFHNQRLSGAFTPSYQFTLWGFLSKIGINTYYQYNKIKQNQEEQSEFNHKEWNEYIYLDINRGWSNFSIAASIGMDIVSRDVDGHKDDYINFRPVVNLGYRFNNNHSLAINYNMQATPPDVLQLNPYNTSSDTLSIITGNPYLKPYKTQQIKLNYTLTSGNLYVEPFVNFRKVTDAIVSTGENDNSQRYLQSLANQGSSDVWSMGFNFRYNISKIGFIGLNMNYHTIRFPDISQKDEHITGRVFFGLNHKKFSLSGSYNLPTNSYDMYKRTYSSPDSRVSLSYAASANLDLSLGMRFILWDKRFKTWTDMPGYTYRYDNQFTNRENIILIGLRYKMQNNKPGRSQKKLENTEKGFRVIKE